MRDASGLLPAQAIAQTAITGAMRSAPALLESSVRVAELAIRQVTPAPSAATPLSHADGAKTKTDHASGEQRQRGGGEPEGGQVPGSPQRPKHAAAAKRGDKPSGPARRHAQVIGQRRTEHEHRVVGDRHRCHHEQQDPDPAIARGDAKAVHDPRPLPPLRRPNRPARHRIRVKTTNETAFPANAQP